MRRVLGDPYALYPEGAPRGPDGGDQPARGATRTPADSTAPFVMAAINTRVVRRSNALLGFAYGKGFRYDEAVDTGPGPAGFARAAGISAGIVGVAPWSLAALRPGRELLSRFLPAPGEGPSRAQRESGGFRIEIHAARSPAASGSPASSRARATRATARPR